MKRHLQYPLLFAITAAAAGPATAQLYINELYWDPPGSAGDLSQEYIEIRGEPGFSLQNHYLIFLEAEPGAGPNGAGSVDHIFDLGAFSLGSNGFLSLRQKNNPYTPVAGGNNPANTGSEFTESVLIFPPNPTIVKRPPGWGNGAGFSLPEGSPNPTIYGMESTVGSSDSYEPNSIYATSGRLENAAFTALLIRNDGGDAPVIDEDLDAGDDGLDNPSGKAGWTILDSIGMVNESAESATAVVYGQVNFLYDDVPPDFVPNMPAGATFELLNYELEYAARWGNSTGQTPYDWHISNLTDSGMSGYVEGSGELRQSASDITPNDQSGPPESSKGVPYGTVMTNTIGGPNFIFGDFTKDGVVDIADYTVWRDGLGVTYSIADYHLWRDNYGAPLTPAPGVASQALAGLSVPTPEPAAMGLALLALLPAAGLAHKANVLS